MKGGMADVHLQTFKIGSNSFVWSFAVICENVVVGDDSVIGSGVFIGRDCSIGNNVRIQHGAFIVDRMIIPDDVFIGPCVVFTNDKWPVSGNKNGYVPMSPTIGRGASFGANCTILPGIRIGKHAMIGAGATVTKDVPDYGVVVGERAKWRETRDPSCVGG